MSTTVTVTGKIGPGIVLTSKVFSDVATVAFQTDKGLLVLTYVNSSAPTYIDISTATTVTYTISGSTVTVSVS